MDDVFKRNSRYAFVYKRTYSITYVQMYTVFDLAYICVQGRSHLQT